MNVARIEELQLPNRFHTKHEYNWPTIIFVQTLFEKLLADRKFQ